MILKSIYTNIIIPMDKKLNEFKISAMRNFGSENISFTSTVYSSNMVLTDEEVTNQINQISTVIDKALRATSEREITEKSFFAETSARRTEATQKLTEALKVETEVALEGQSMVIKAERINKGKKNKS